ncbi:tetratricopeptide repeat protein [Mariniphaga sp.]|uniref:tetratricopeptide repeat protein n=1 Tax=Mariniphaga sp. TaxID=1954475 RepID=UPI0035683A47
MKAVFRISLLMASLVLAAVTTIQAQRVIKGTVYREGKPAAGVTVEAHRGGTMMTSFDGKYELEASDKTKWIRFTFINESERLDISDKPGDVFDFAFDGKLPGDETEIESGDVVLKSAEELIREQDRDFMNELSLYNEFYKQDNIESALPHWRMVYNKYPKSTLNLYIHGANMHQKLIENASTPEEKSKYIDDLMKLYDKRIRHFGEKGYVLGRKAADWLKYKLDNDREQDNGDLKETMKKGYDWLSESVTERGNETELPVLVLLMQTTRSLFKLGDLPKETVVKNYDSCNSILNSIREKTTDEETIKNVTDVQAYIEDIFGTSGAADCEALISIFTPQYQENISDVDFIKNMLRRLGNAKCEESPLFSEATERLYELEPSAEAAFNMARRYLKRDDSERAKKYYQQAMEQETDKELLSKYYYEYALFIYAKENALQEARSYARRALEINSDYCEALMLIGNIYVAASRSYGSDDFEKSTVFWLAVDYYERARSNPDCAVDASKEANSYRRYFPNKEEAFFRSLQEGQTYKVGGWINETTKVRF